MSAGSTKWALVGMAALVLPACGAAQGSAPVSLGQADQVREAPATRAAAERAPQAIARGDAFLREAKAALASGDGPTADLLSERALAAYERARTVGRASRAQEELESANAEGARTAEALRAVVASRQEAEKDADELERRLRVARDGRTPTASGPATPEREAARLVAARSLVAQAQELCAAARLLMPNGDAAVPEAEANKLAVQLQGTPRAATSPIDAAARVRASCLSALTRARRSGAIDVLGEADALLTELSASGAWASSANGSLARDERGVVVMLRTLLKGSTLTPEGAAQLKELARVATTHKSTFLQVVAHEARPDVDGASLKKAEVVAKGLVDAGVATERVQPISAGHRIPVVDPADARGRERNERIEIVFVTRSP
jgi:hypothetical protein